MGIPSRPIEARYVVIIHLRFVLQYSRGRPPAARKRDDRAVHDAGIQLSRSNGGEIDNVEVWLVTVVGRVALKMLRSRRTRPSKPLDAYLLDRADGVDPEHETPLVDSVGLGLLVVLEPLTPAERLAYILHGMFSVPLHQIGAILDRSPEAAH